MKVLVAGATGWLGRSLLPKLIAAGHEVTGMIRSESSAAGVRAQGAEVVFADGLNADAVKAAVAEAQPEVVVHQMTALKGGIDAPPAYDGSWCRATPGGISSATARPPRPRTCRWTRIRSLLPGRRWPGSGTSSQS